MKINIICQVSQYQKVTISYFDSDIEAIEKSHDAKMMYSTCGRIMHKRGETRESDKEGDYDQ